MNQADGLLPLKARNLSNLADMGAYSGDELPPTTSSRKAATDCEDSLSARELDNVDRGVAGRPHDTMNDSMGDDADGGFDHLAKKAEKDFGEDPAHEFWSWDKGEQRWVHKDEKTGVSICAPEELD
uniref:Uncharacterized protein n=1 Tax=Colletotrichum fructicola (strain Nara gc5) TaxID=1213859 RepID=L2GJ41_COLFN